MNSLLFFSTARRRLNNLHFRLERDAVVAAAAVAVAVASAIAVAAAAVVAVATQTMV